MTLNGGQAGRADWMAVFPIKKHEFSAGCTKGRAKTGGPANCTLGRPAQESEPTCCNKGRAGGPHDRARGRAALKGGLHSRARRRAALKSGLHKAGRRAAQQGEPAGCTKLRTGGLHINTYRRTAQQGGPAGGRKAVGCA